MADPCVYIEPKMNAAAETSAPALTLAQVKSYHRSRKTQALKDKLFLARANAIIMRGQIDAILVPAFANTNYTDDDSGERITREGDLYLTDADCSDWYRTRDDLLIAAGYKLESLECGWCPALTADAHVIEVENELIVHASKHFGIDYTRLHTTKRAHAIELFSANAK